MSFRSREALADWLEEFGRLDSPAPIPARVIEQDGSEGGNTGLVAVSLAGGLGVYIQPEDPTSERWVVTLEAREDAADLSHDELARLAAEFTTLAELCAFLEEKSRAADDG